MIQEVAQFKSVVIRQPVKLEIKTMGQKPK